MPAAPCAAALFTGLPGRPMTALTPSRLRTSGIRTPRIRSGLAALTVWLASLASTAPSAAADAPPVPRVLPDSLAQRALACTGCHGANGRSTPLGYVPRIASKSAGYLTRQLIAFRDGRRHHATMARLLAPLDDAYLAALAGHFAQLDEPYAAPRAGRASPDPAAAALVRKGDPARQLPACTACHGTALLGVQPGVPGLLGLPRDYLVAQLGAWRNGQRRTAAPDCMAEVARRLTPAEVAAVADWLGSQPVATPSKPAATPPARWPMDCAGLPP
jgi:cytochrome c553